MTSGKRRRGWVYFAEAGGGDYIKIGFSTRVEKRMGEFGTLRPSNFSVTLIGTIPGSRRTEWGLHKKFAAHRDKGEWFRAAPELKHFVKRVGVFPPEEMEGLDGIPFREVEAGYLVQINPWADYEDIAGCFMVVRSVDKESWSCQGYFFSLNGVNKVTNSPVDLDDCIVVGIPWWRKSRLMDYSLTNEEHLDRMADATHYADQEQDIRNRIGRAGIESLD